jgi:hypothetical protein
MYWPVEHAWRTYLADDDFAAVPLKAQARNGGAWTDLDTMVVAVPDETEIVTWWELVITDMDLVGAATEIRFIYDDDLHEDSPAWTDPGEGYTRHFWQDATIGDPELYVEFDWGYKAA